MYNFKNKKGVILGSTGLLGSRLAKKLSELGADLILHGKSKESLKELEETKDNIWNQDPSEVLNSEVLDTINAFHNGMGCECLDYD